MATYRKERREMYTEQDRNTTRLIMSKFEVLQSSRLERELSKIKNFYNGIYVLWLRESKKNIVTFDLQRLTFTLLRVGFVFYIATHISTGAYTIGDLALYWMLLNQIYSSIQELNTYVTRLYEDNIYIQKLRDTFDTTGDIK